MGILCACVAYTVVISYVRGHSNIALLALAAVHTAKRYQISDVYLFFLNAHRSIVVSVRSTSTADEPAPTHRWKACAISIFIPFFFITMRLILPLDY